MAFSDTKKGMTVRLLQISVYFEEKQKHAQRIGLGFGAIGLGLSLIRIKPLQ